MKNDALVTQIYEMVKPIADELNYEIYHVEYVKENGEYYLRIYIEKEGGITLSDCEALSRRVSDLMDEKDPIPEAYFLEVSSPGLNRTLFTEAHYKRFVGREVMVKLAKAIDGKKSVKGILKEVNEENIIVEADTLISIPKEKIKSANIEGEI
ncbi:MULTISPECIES: ribosome maturation factor RimP [unclassified Clostridium]|uniref:ribosome maturation factor RimP n=1 Tax=unclassified Clostridium TaxID=2614128 RepID=UPI00189B4C3E|nr:MULTISPECIES: ribosome maturation factor RimP [unclassified Clostridium]MBP3916994.1 ribosome maturation factor RimP [Clostridium sp.]